VEAGALSLEQACGRYQLTAEEFASWQDAISRHGVSGLKAKALEERRKAPRRALNEPAEALSGAAGRIRCEVTDISSRGARLALRSPKPLPRKFALRCLRSGRSIRVKTVWQRGAEAGVCFDTSLTSPWAIEAGLDLWLLGEI